MHVNTSNIFKQSTLNLLQLGNFNFIPHLNLHEIYLQFSTSCVSQCDIPHRFYVEVHMYVQTMSGCYMIKCKKNIFHLLYVAHQYCLFISVHYFFFVCFFYCCFFLIDFVWHLWLLWFGNFWTLRDLIKKVFQGICRSRVVE